MPRYWPVNRSYLSQSMVAGVPYVPRIQASTGWGGVCASLLVGRRRLCDLRGLALQLE
ncbi:hypothetical protein M406DRAFT_103769 [Cryphonectria parasitica EP155]|uniref:Uncharacterized protein n=1 Tax=Cryphonectria parasitica (strain ATCC 38755 / EP155) TaxID=660469 RepID=A0A9P5CLQ7_CRYP1|nr:uncharacterized protein M406DRAFT_103769 [Cryphonectria parasitica EP155]KAF3763338.1 hypothetical protein M406DRAFT_103769 [Cryphonectria parasitica EP155]